MALLIRYADLERLVIDTDNRVVRSNFKVEEAESGELLQSVAACANRSGNDVLVKSRAVRLLIIPRGFVYRCDVEGLGMGCHGERGPNREYEKRFHALCLSMFRMNPDKLSSSARLRARSSLIRGAALPTTAPDCGNPF